jgi:hypothetical protein
VISLWSVCPPQTACAMMDPKRTQLFGKVSPAGRAIQTIYPSSYQDEISIFDFGMRPGPSVFPRPDCATKVGAEQQLSRRHRCRCRLLILPMLPLSGLPVSLCLTPIDLSAAVLSLGTVLDQPRSHARRPMWRLRNGDQPGTHSPVMSVPAILPARYMPYNVMHTAYLTGKRSVVASTRAKLSWNSVSAFLTLPSATRRRPAQMQSTSGQSVLCLARRRTLAGLSPRPRCCVMPRP